MESGRREGSETSSGEDDRNVKEDTVTTTNKRSYECIFCKRGFTNAQALGGHMNIHRKDRAKGKTTGNSSKVYDQDHANPNYYIPPVSSDHHQHPVNYCLGMESSNQASYGVNFQSSGLNPRQSYGYGYHRGPSPRPSSTNVNDEELWGANLSLRIGSNLQVQENQNKEDDLDLELRLGHDP